MTVLEVENLKKIYRPRFGGNQVQALSKVTFSVEEGEYVAIMGESGSGKTTLLNMLAALDKPTEGEVYLDGSHENKVWRFYQEQTNDPVLAYAISLKEVRDGKIFGNLYPLNYREHVERMKKLTCPIGNVAVAFADGNVITIPYQERRQFMNRLMPEHGAPKTMTYLPENEPELMMILKRERFKRSYHATAGNLEEYLDKLEKTTLREKLKRAKTVVSTQEVSSHKRGLER